MPELRDLLDPIKVSQMQAIVADVTSETPADVIAATREAIEAQRNVESIRKTAVAKHRPRTTDGIDHPVAVTTKEKRVIDLSSISDAELGSIVRERMMMSEAERIESRRQAALRDLVRAESTDRSLRTQAQAERVDHVLPGFSANGVSVPALDLSDVPSLDESPSSAIRSPYNKVRFRMLKQEALDPEETTYRTLEAEHLRLATLASQQPVKPVKQANGQDSKQVTQQVTAVLADTGRQTKAAALAEVKGISVDQALALMTALGI